MPAATGPRYCSRPTISFAVVEIASLPAPMPM